MLKMYRFILFLTLCIVPLPALSGDLIDDIMSHKNWKFLPTANACGQNRHRTRIVGGHKAQLGRFPWFCRLGYANEHNQKKVEFRCGGTLINDRYVLTAAHCIKGLEKTLNIVRLGDNLSNMPTDCTHGKCAPSIRDIHVEEIIIHPEFNVSSYRGDIALIRLNDRVEHSVSIQPICMPRDNMLEKSWFGEKFTVIGWGRDQASEEELSNFLRYVEVPMRDLCACTSIYSQLTLDESQMCVGLEDGKDSCDGDSGGPLTWVTRVGFTPIHYHIGLVSFGKSYCGEAPSIYSSTIYYMRWILDNIGDTNYNDIDDDEMLV